MEVGDYVRTSWGYICEIVNINDFREPCMKYGVEARYLKDIMFIGDEDIIKSSPNIIDLIEVGDFIDGKQVVKVIHCSDGFNRIELFGGKAIMNKTPIKSIVTKEQFESMEYKIGE